MKVKQHRGPILAPDFATAFIESFLDDFLVSAILYALLYVVYAYRLIGLDDIPGLPRPLP